MFFVHGLICSLLMLRTGSIVYSFAKLLTMKELFFYASLWLKANYPGSCQFRGSFISVNEMRGKWCIEYPKKLLQLFHWADLAQHALVQKIKIT